MEIKAINIKQKDYINEEDFFLSCEVFIGPKDEEASRYYNDIIKNADSKQIIDEIKDEFEGDNLFIKCIVTYENNKINDSEVVIQDFILPYLENNLIINYETLSLQLNNQDRILLTTGDGIFYIKENKVLFSYFI